MRFRKLRIAWSVAWGLVAVLLIVLWARSYYYYEFVWGISSRGSTIIHRTAFDSWQGRARFNFNERTSRRSQLAGALDWRWTSIRAAEFERRLEREGNRMFVTEPRRFASLTMGPNRWSVWVKYWLLFLTAAILAVIPWVSQISRLRFSLRALLIATTLVAVVLGLAVYAVKR